MKFLTAHFIALSLFFSSCAVVTVTNKSGADAVISIEGDAATQVAPNSTKTKTVSARIFEPESTIPISVEGIYTLVVSNVKTGSSPKIGVTVSANRGAIRIVNQSGRTVTSIQCTPSTNSNWGPNFLGSETLPTGGEMIFGAGVGYWDVRLIDSMYVVSIYNNKLTAGVTVTRTWNPSTVTAPARNLSDLKHP